MDKGLSFIPTVLFVNLETINSSLNATIRKLHIKDFFSYRIDDFDPSDFHNKFTESSQWYPPLQKISQETVLTTSELQECTTNILNPYTTHGPRGPQVKLKEFSNNLTREERAALADLKSNVDITIKPADKGGATVVMDTSLYCEEGWRQLNNIKYYRPLDNFVYPEAAELIRPIIDQLQESGYINAKQAAFLAPDLSRANARRLYLLPKIHKPRYTWPHERLCACRPIVSDSGSESYNICKYIDFFLKPLTIKHESYIKDTYDFISKIRGTKIAASTLLVTGDVTSLYTNMHIDGIIACIQELFIKYPDPERPDRELLELLRITLTYNDFEFAGKIFLQILGVAMGRTYAPSTANAYLLKFDNAAKQGWRIALELFFRFLDDIFFLFPGTVQELEEFERFLNSIIPDIQVTLKYSTSSVEFLDTIVYKKMLPDGSCILQTKVYFKPTDTHQLLHKHSFHPPHTFKAILRSQFIRFKRISSGREDFEEASDILSRVLRARGYTRRLISHVKNDVWQNYDLRTVRTEINLGNTIPIVTHFDRLQSKLNRTWRQEIAKNSHFSNMRLLPSFKIHKNLRQILTSSKVKSYRSPALATMGTALKCTAHVQPCLHPRCMCCEHLEADPSRAVRTHIATASVTLTCNSKNLIYLIHCNKCGARYVGETKRQLKDRLNNHRSDIATRKQTAIAIHFNKAHHSVTNLRITPIEQMQTESDVARKAREKFYINKLETKFPRGLNSYPIP